MAMLAESRKRYKWMYNPRGMDWVNDDNKYGKKLMEKMGWSKGKGLGRTEQGNVDHIEVNVKNDSKGIGFKVTDDAWIKHYEGFENVLAALNSENNSAAASPIGSAPNSTFNSEDEDTKVSSLEALSKSSQARVHYHKFTRGKDLSLLNPDDIACITGSKRAKKLAKLVKEEDFHEDEVGHTQNNGGLTTIKGGNIQDYFAKKWAAIKGKTSQQEDAVETFGSSYLSAETGDAADEPATFLKKKEKKKRKKEVNIDDETHIHTDVYLQECGEDGTEKKSRKVRDRDMKKESERVVEEQDDYSESLEEQQQKKKKKKRISKCEENVNNEEGCTISADLEEALPKKKKKSKRSLEEKEMEDEPSVETACLADESRVMLDIEHEEKKLKKKKKKRDCIDESECKDVNDISVFLEEPPKKKKKKLMSEEKALESHECANDLIEKHPVPNIKKDEGYLENNELAHKKKKKKSKSDVEENNKSNDKMDNFDDSSVGDSRHKKKKKSKHRES